MDNEFDVFLSHSGMDKSWVRQLKVNLGKYGVKSWLDIDEIKAGEMWAERLAQGLQASKSVALIISPDAVTSDWVREEYYSRLAEHSGTIIPVILKEAELLPFMGLRQWVDFRDEDKYDENVRQLVWGITGEEPVGASPEDIKNFIIFLDEIIREDRSEDPRYKFIDPRGFMDTLMAKRHHVIFGRRGSGKSVFLRAVESKCEVEDHNIKALQIDLGVINVKYPNVIGMILVGILSQLQEEIISKRPLKGFIRLSAKKERLIDRLKEAVQRLDEELSTSPQLSPGVFETYGKDFDNYRGLIEEWLELMVDDFEAIFLIVDDFYQVSPANQAHVADYLNRLFSGMPCYLKIATVPGGTRLYANGQGIQHVDDYSSIDLDFLMEDFNNPDGPTQFLGDLFTNICGSGIGDFNCAAVFADREDAINILTETSGGNPRIFITLLKEVLEEYKTTNKPVEQSNIRNIGVKFARRRKKDAENSANLDSLKPVWKKIVSHCQDYLDIGFCITEADLKRHPELARSIRQLEDLQLIHLFARNYPRPIGDCFAYVLSPGVYHEIEPQIGFFQNTSLAKRLGELKMYPTFALSQIT